MKSPIFARYFPRVGSEPARAYVIAGNSGPTLQIRQLTNAVEFLVTGSGGFSALAWEWRNARAALLSIGADPMFLSLAATLALPFVSGETVRE